MSVAGAPGLTPAPTRPIRADHRRPGRADHRRPGRADHRGPDGADHRRPTAPTDVPAAQHLQFSPNPPVSQPLWLHKHGEHAYVAKVPRGPGGLARCAWAQPARGARAQPARGPWARCTWAQPARGAWAPPARGPWARGRSRRVAHARSRRMVQNGPKPRCGHRLPGHKHLPGAYVPEARDGPGLSGFCAVGSVPARAAPGYAGYAGDAGYATGSSSGPPAESRTSQPRARISSRRRSASA
jgi:hypothetical protein